MGRREASLGTLVPRTSTVAPGPKARSDLASRRSQSARAKRRGAQSRADLVDAWRLMGRGCLHFPTLPRQPVVLTTTGCMQKNHHYLELLEASGWAPSGYKRERGRSPLLISVLSLLTPPSSSSSHCLVKASMAPGRRFSAVEKGKTPRVEPELLPLKKRPDCSRNAATEPMEMRPWHEQARVGSPVPVYACAQGPTHRSGG